MKFSKGFTTRGPGRLPARIGLQRSGRLRQEAFPGANQQRCATGAHEAAHQLEQGDTARDHVKPLETTAVKWMAKWMA